MARALLLVALLALAALVGAQKYAPVYASFTFVLDVNSTTGQPIVFGESALAASTYIPLATLKAVSLANVRDEYGIEFFDSAFEGFANSSAPYRELFNLAPIAVNKLYGVISLYDSLNRFSNEFDRATDRPDALLGEYAVTVNATTLFGLHAQGIFPVYGGRYGSVSNQLVMPGDVIAAGAYNITQVRYDDAREGRNRGKAGANEKGCRRRVVTEVWAFASRVPGPSVRYSARSQDAGASFGFEAFRTYSKVYGHGAQHLYVNVGPVVNGTQAISYRNSATFPDTFGSDTLPVYPASRAL